MQGFEPVDLRGQAARKLLKLERDTDAADILMFIGRFSTNSSGTTYREQVIECFTQGCCYWFAYILKARFEDEKGAEIVSDYTAGHFGTLIRGHVYDITGDVTDAYTWEPWPCDDDLREKRITDGCIMF